MEKQIQREKQNIACIRVILASAAVFLFISYLGVKFQMQGFLSF